MDSLPELTISEPTMQIQISPSTSPLVGQDGKFTTSRQIKQRLEKELETNVSLKLAPGTSGESFIVSGRGELHLAILIETMRREGYEFSVGKPEVIIKTVDGKTHEPWEMITIEIIKEKTGVIIDTLGKRKATMTNMQTIGENVRFNYKISTANALGLRSELLTNTSGLAVINSQLIGFEQKGESASFNRNGALISTETGQALAYSIYHIQERATTFVEPGEKVYTGMIVGQNNKPGDMFVNICKGKQLTNMRAASADATLKIAPAVKMSLEQCLNFLNADELLEVTPKNLRLRKKDLSFKR
jgi:GTP-binding protein